MRNVKRQLFKSPGNTGKRIFSNVGTTNISKTTRDRVLQTMATVKSPEIKPPLTPRHGHMRQEWATTYMKLEMRLMVLTVGLVRAKNDTDVFGANNVVAV